MARRRSASLQRQDPPGLHPCVGMDPRAFLELARTLEQRTEAQSYRSAVSRAYYAVFNVGVQLLEGLCRTDGANFQIPKDGTAHGHVRAILAQSGDRELQKVAQDLK